uniref:FecR domain-containing protein n=1 Tax=Roseihalotalea indica TaxID=2867963 RepID=A0AA49GP07_9BACT|nr:FecR domain-containing protein [Tunicatimonas sp. TK19036]
MDRQKYSAEDFVLDPHFREWVLRPNREINLFWEAWVARHPEKVNVLQEARTLLLTLPQEKHQLNPAEIDHLWNLIDHEADKVNPQNTNPLIIPLHASAILQKSGNTIKEKWSYEKLGRLAASVLIVITLGLSYLLASREQPVPLPESKLISKENPWGQRSTIYLSDGTEVELNAGSRLVYDEAFTPKERKVVLEGEAFFKVSKDKSRPFRVVAAGLLTEALGTAFNVKAYDTANVAIALVEGKVRVNRAEAEYQNEGLLLNPGEGTLYQANQELVKYQYDPKRTLAWKEGIIYFEDADEATVFSTLEQWYGVEFEKINRSPKPWSYTASYQNKSLENILLSLSFGMEFDYRIEQKIVTITYQ